MGQEAVDATQVELVDADFLSGNQRRAQPEGESRHSRSNYFRHSFSLLGCERRNFTRRKRPLENAYIIELAAKE